MNVFLPLSPPVVFVPETPPTGRPGVIALASENSAPPTPKLRNPRLPVVHSPLFSNGGALLRPMSSLAVEKSKSPQKRLERQCEAFLGEYQVWPAQPKVSGHIMTERVDLRLNRNKKPTHFLPSFRECSLNALAGVLKDSRNDLEVAHDLIYHNSAHKKELFSDSAPKKRLKLVRKSIFESTNCRSDLYVAEVRKMATQKENNNLGTESGCKLKEMSMDSETDSENTRNSNVNYHFEEVEIQSRMFEFFATADRHELIDTLLCTVEQADTIIESRPFASIRDMREKFEIHKRGKKRISKLIEKYGALMEGYIQVDRLISKCETTSSEVMSVLKDWIEESKSSANSASLFSEREEISRRESLKSGGGLYITAMPLDAKFEGSLSIQPKMMNNKMQLTSYQLVGANWLYFLYNKKLGGILADEAEREIIREDLAAGSVADFDAVITTYNLAAGCSDDRKFLRRLNPRSLILDEGHMVKNMQSSRYQTLNQITAPFRLLLTGTPLQNNLMELFSLLIFIMPRIFANEHIALRQIFSLKNTSPSEAALLNKQRINRAKQMMTPFVLRRKKVDVLTDLPRKIRKTILCDMTANQQILYKRILASEDMLYVNDQLEQSSKTLKSDYQVNGGANLLMKLRKAANHPLLFRRIYDDAKVQTIARQIMQEDQYIDASMDCILEDMMYLSDFQLHSLCKKFKSIRKYALINNEWMDSGKVQLLKRILPDMIAKGDRVLIFSQFVIMLDVLETVLETLGVKFLRLDGATNVGDRQSLIDEFNGDPSISVFLLSTKAGGLGLNLTCANVVILHDMDFNPHNDAQAEDRAHRVGQLREVTVLKLVAPESVEEQIVKLANTKLQLDQSLQAQNDLGDPARNNESEGVNGVDEKRLMEILRAEWKAG
ncbi:hypothetical protein HDU84_006311 [Entophlyctis sp. JEL0112]|nr:hypothetical protein HDU84_006311 [Entophlyctis sp. JEL0112]